ncbi:MAG: hypothetical protein ACYCYM_11870 [Saccharofermentanales bacterium]
MKKILILLLMIIISFTCWGCTNKIDNDSNEIIGNNIAANSSSVQVITRKGDWPYYENTEELIEACDHILIGKVEKVLPAIRINETVEDVIFLEEGFEYLLFVRGEENVGKGMEYSYFLPTPNVGYCKIIDGKLSPNEGNNLFISGTTVDEAIAMIEECLNIVITSD